MSSDKKAGQTVASPCPCGNIVGGTWPADLPKGRNVAEVTCPCGQLHVFVCDIP